MNHEQSNSGEMERRLTKALQGIYHYFLPNVLSYLTSFRAEWKEGEEILFYEITSQMSKINDLLQQTESLNKPKGVNEELLESLENLHGVAEFWAVDYKDSKLYNQTASAIAKAKPTLKEEPK